MGGHKNLSKQAERSTYCAYACLRATLFLLPFEAGPIRLVPKRLMQEGEGLENLEPQAKEG
jgi:hypothetical protein